MTGKTKKALIYARVSSKTQEEEGHGLQSQETRCRDHARTNGYEVEAVFPDTITGGGDFMKRPGMVALLSYMDAQPDEDYVVIFDDLKRFARDTRFHLDLREAFRERGATIECLNFKFDETSLREISPPDALRAQSNEAYLQCEISDSFLARVFVQFQDLPSIFSFCSILPCIFLRCQLSTPLS